MENKNARTAKLLATIGSMMCMAMAVFMFILSIFNPIEVTINDSYVRGTLPELVAYPAHLTFLLVMLVGLFIIEIIALLIGRHVPKKATTVQGVILIVIGFPAMVAIGAGILFIIAGVQTFLAKKVRELTA